MDQLSVIFLTREALYGGHLAQDSVRRADAQRPVVRKREAVMLRRLLMQDDVATDLVDPPIGPSFARNRAS